MNPNLDYYSILVDYSPNHMVTRNWNLKKIRLIIIQMKTYSILTIRDALEPRLLLEKAAATERERC